MAAARGAVGLITIRTRAEAARTPWPRMLRQSPIAPGTTWLGAGRHALRRRRGPALQRDARRRRRRGPVPGARRAARRSPRRSGARRRAGRAASPCAATAQVARGRRAATRFSSPNVIAVLPGTDPALAGEYVLLMAHLDHLGIREPRPGDAADADRISNGAMDNATGIATLIEVARADEPRDGNRPRRPILFAAVTAEEKGLLGAEFLARHPVVGHGRIVSVVNLDMPILTYDFQDVIAFGAEHSTHGADRRAGGGADGRAPLARSAARGGPVHPLRPLQVRARGRALGLPDDRLRRRGRARVHAASWRRAITASATTSASHSTGRPGAHSPSSTI